MGVGSAGEAQPPPGERPASAPPLRLGPALAAGLTLLLLLPAWWLTGSWYAGRLLADERAQVASRVSAHGVALTNALHQRLALLQGLQAFTEAHTPELEAELAWEFGVFAARLHGSAEGIRNLVVAPGGVNRLVYPEAGNAAAIGHNLLTDPRPEVRRDVERAIQSRRVVLSGPYELRQGGLGLVARVPVFRDGAFWGLCSMVLDVPPLLRQAGLEGDVGGLALALRDEHGRVFEGRPAVFEQSPAVFRVALPDGRWELAGVPAAGWGRLWWGYRWLVQGIGLTLVGLLAVLAGVVAGRQARLGLLVEERTRALAEANARLTLDVAAQERAERALQEREVLLRETERLARVGGWEFDPETLQGTWTEETARIHELEPGQPASVGLGLSFFQGESRARIEAGVAAAVESGVPYDLELEQVTARGNRRWVRTIGHPQREGGRTVRVRGSIQDITDRKRAEEALRARTRQLEAVQGVTAEVTRELELDRLLELVNRHAMDLLGVCGGVVWLWDEAGGVLVPRIWQGYGDWLREIRVRPGEFIVGRVAERREGMLVNDYRGSPLASARVLAETAQTAILAEPLLYQEQLLGVIIAAAMGDERQFTAEDQGLLRLFAGQAAVAVQNARLHASLQAHAVELEQRVEARTEELAERMGEVERLNRGMLNLLEDQQEANRRLEAATARLGEVNAELEAFAYSVSHDLRAPLRAIDGFTRILQEDHGSALDGEGNRLLGVVRESVGRMGLLIDGLLLYSRVGRAELRRVAVDMAALAQEAFDEALASDPRPESLTFELGPLPPAVGDPILLRQVWANLLGNALKFSAPKPERIIRVGWRPIADGGLQMAELDSAEGADGRSRRQAELPGSPPAATATCQPPPDGIPEPQSQIANRNSQLVYFVQDNGVGFDMRYADKLFGTFQRLHGRGEFEGTGVGLALVQRIVLRHGGQVWAAGQVGEGATFSFSIGDFQFAIGGPRGQ